MKKFKLRLEIFWRLLTKSNVIFINYGFDPTTAHIVTNTKYSTELDIAALRASVEFLNGNIRESDKSICPVCENTGKIYRHTGHVLPCYKCNK